MKYEGKSNVISLGDTKQAALYFERVIIVDPAEQMGIWGLPGQLSEGAYRLLFGDPETEQDLLRYNYQFQEYRKSVAMPGASFTRIPGSDYFQSNTRNKLIEGYIDNNTLENGTNIRDALGDFAGQLGIGNYSVLLPPAFTGVDQANDDDLSLTLANIPLIDTDKTSWEQIFELRRDVESLKKLRKLRVFLQEKYDQKDSSFIEDDISGRLDEYANVCRDHGLETCLSVLSVILDARHLQTAIAGGVAAALLGNPIAGLSTAVSVELGHVTLELARRKIAFNKFKRNHELAYIIDARQKLEA